MMRKKFDTRWLGGLAVLSTVLAGCTASAGAPDKVTEIEILNYKPEAVKTFEEIEKRFNETHDDIKLKVSSPNEAMTILKTRLVREDYPDIVGIGGDINYSNFLDAGLFENLDGLESLDQIKEGYLQIDKDLELVEQEGTYALPFAANAAGILYNKEMFEEHGWQVPRTWDELIDLCEQIQSEGILPFYAGYKDTWTTLAPWNVLAVGLADPDTPAQVNRGETTFSEAYREPALRIKELLKYMEPNPFAYSYNDAATAFARSQSAMWAIGSYAIPQIKSVNPDMEIGSFTMPTGETKDENTLNSGIDLQFSILKDSDHKEEAKEVLEFLNSDEIIALYLDQQGGVAAKEGDFKIPEELSDMKEYIESGKVADFQDHQYPSEMAVDAMIQTYLLDDSEESVDTFLAKFDSDWQRYNRDLIRRLKNEKDDPAAQKDLAASQKTDNDKEEANG